MDSLLKEKSNKDISKLFDDIAHRYDFLNHFLSFSIDKLWRKKLVRLLKAENPVTILDVATGTADLAILTIKKIPGSRCTGIDISEKMLEKGRSKIRKNKLESNIDLLNAPAENMPFPDDNFDAAIVAFGVRNFQNLSSGLREILRVIKPEKKVFILEFSKPGGLFKTIFGFYFRFLLPFVGSMVSGNKTAYKYLYDSVENFPHGDTFVKIMNDSGFNHIRQIRLSGGIATIYVGKK